MWQARDILEKLFFSLSQVVENYGFIVFSIGGKVSAPD